MLKTGTKNQFLAALIVNIIALSVGASVGWASPFLPTLQSSESPLERAITPSEASWLGSFLALGALCGTLLFGWLSERLGRFPSLLVTASTEMTWWLCVAFSESFEMLLFGRFMSGLGAGGVSVLVPVYVAEISEDKVRGTLGSLFIFSLNLGTLWMFVAGSCWNYSDVPKFMMALPVTFLVFFVLLPETPQHLLKCGKAKKAESSLKFLRGCGKSAESLQLVRHELLEMTQKIKNDSLLKRQSVYESIKIAASRKALIIGLVLVTVNQLSGCFAFIVYTAEIFKASGSSLSPNMSATIIAAIQVAGSTASTFAIGSFPRKSVYVTACLGIVAGQLLFGAHGFMKIYYDLSAFAWVPIVSLSVVIFAAALGLLPLTFVILSEILSPKIRSFGVSSCTAVLWAISFLLLRYFATLVALLQLNVCMFIFSAFTLFGIVFVVLFVPETRNKSSEEIERALET